MHPDIRNALVALAALIGAAAATAGAIQLVIDLAKGRP